MNDSEGPSSNVVSLQRGSRDKRESELGGSLPATVEVVRDKAQQQLVELVKQVFAKVDDSLFAMGEKAHGQDEQDGLFQALRLLRVERRRVVEQFADKCAQAFYVQEAVDDEFVQDEFVCPDIHGRRAVVIAVDDAKPAALVSIHFTVACASINRRAAGQ